MIQIPLPWLIAVLTSILLLPLLRAERLPLVTRLGLGAALVGFGMIGVLLGLRFSFQAEWAQIAQPFIAVWIPIAFWLGYAGLTIEDPYPWKTMLKRHGAVGLISVIGVALRGADVILPILTLIYLVAMIRLLLRPDEAFLHLSPKDLRIMRGALLITVVLFVFTFLADLSILIAIALGRPGQVAALVSGASGVLTAFVFLTMLIGLPLIIGRSTGASSSPSSEAPTDEDRALLARFDAMLTETALFTDNGLTLARAARRLGVPARALSRAVNRIEGQNFSRHINALRVAHAQQLLQDTDLPVTDVMLEAGFLTKSTFNTEFRRITGHSPSTFRAQG